MVTRLPDPGTHVPVASPIGDALMRVSGSGVAEAALRYAEAGIPVLPCLPGGKRPITAHGLHDATIDPRQIASGPPARDSPRSIRPALPSWSTDGRL
jgi:hypothetical protein